MTELTSPSILVVGHGSIGKLHAEILKGLGCEVGVVTAQAIEVYPSYFGLAEALAAKDWQGMVIANPTSLHASTLHTLHELGFTGRILVEKPMLACPSEVPVELVPQITVGYNLRFHPLMERLRAELVGQSVITVLAYVGQYLPSWRPARDYRESYSAKRAEGGGVLRDLSHELDFLRWLFGSATNLVALGGHLSPLEIDVEDSVTVLMETTRVPKITVEMNYLDRPLSRYVVVNGTEHTWHLDLKNARLCRDGEEIATATMQRHTTYEKQARAWLAGDASVIASCSEGLAVIGLIERIEQSLTTRQWMPL